MHRRIATLFPLALAGMFALPALADNVKPGLWESTSRLRGGGEQIQMAVAALQGLPPEQRRHIEDMLRRQGVTMSQDGAVMGKMCLTREMAAKQEMPLPTQGNCSYQRSTVTGATWKFAGSCTNPQASAEGSITVTGGNAFTGSLQVSSSVTGAPETRTFDLTGRWLGADCGDLRPAAPSARR